MTAWPTESRSANAFLLSSSALILILFLFLFKVRRCHSLFHSLYHYHLIMACIPQLFPFAFASFCIAHTHTHTHTPVISALFSSPLLIYITNCARIKLHATRCDASQRIAFCVYRSFFAFVFTVWIGNEIGLKQQQSESKTKLVFICIHTFTYIHTIQYKSVYRVRVCVCADNNSCLLSVLVFCFYFETRFLALCPFLGMVLSTYVHIRVHFLLLLMYFATSTLDLAVVNTLIRMQSKKMWKLQEI